MTDERPVRYCLITASYRQGDGANRDGWATYAEMMADSLRAGGVHVTVVVIHEALDTEASKRDVSPDTVHVQFRWRYQISRRLPGISEGLQLMRAVRALEGVDPFDVIEGPNVAGICWALALRYRRKFLLRVHTSLVSPRGESAAKRTLRQGFKWQLDAFTGRRAARVVTHSAAHAATVSNQYGIDAARITLVPHAVTDAGTVAAGGPRRILAIAGPARRKGVDVLLAAFARVHARVPDAELVIVGTSPAELTAMLAELPQASASLAQCIRALGPLTDAELKEQWAAAAIVAVPSRYESFGLVAVEGMARGKAVVVTNGGALGEVVGNGGIVVPLGDANALAEAIARVMEEPGLRERLGAAGRRRYESHYRPEALTTRMLQLIEGIRRAEGSAGEHVRW